MSYVSKSIPNNTDLVIRYNFSYIYTDNTVDKSTFQVLTDSKIISINCVGLPKKYFDIEVASQSK